ncbi:hypothetical protein MPSEU_000904000 [Mayamaea pseudoterrestris]|nr:hypothetical protein MPSEU_000904000 [Mayamaea pseudoterrestris]
MFRPQPQQQQQPQQQAVIALPDPGDVGAIIVRGAKNFARRYKIVTGSYLLGVCILLFFGAGIPLSQQQRRDYNRIMDSIDLQAEYAASQNYWRAREAYSATKGWFSCDDLCQRNKQRMNQAEQKLNAIRKEGNARMTDAKRVAGVFSEIAVDETKDTFWQYYHGAKQFAKRQSMWDMMFMGIRSMSRGRDESWIEFGLKVLLNVLINLSMGLIMALVLFVCNVFSIVRSYSTNPVTAVAFFVGASCAAFSFVATYLLAVYGAAAGSVYGLLKFAEASQRQRIADQRRREGINYQRPHYD